MRVVQCVVFLWLSVFAVMAGSELQANANSTASSVDPAAQASLPPTPQPQTVVDQTFIAVMAALGASKGISFATSTRIREREWEKGALGY